MNFYFSEFHKYCLSCNGARMRSRVFNSRREANIAMYEFCAANGIKVECVDDSKHDKLYSDNEGITFCISRI